MIERTKRNFNKGILNIINLMKYPIYAVTCDKNIKCTCYKQGTSQADPNCPRCLGSGYKITIKETEGACNETGAPAVMRNTTAFVISRSYYIPSDIQLENDDFIIDDGEPWFVIQAPEFRSFGGERIYKKYVCMNKKLDVNIFMTNFNNIINK